MCPSDPYIARGYIDCIGPEEGKHTNKNIHQRIGIVQSSKQRIV